MHKKLFVAVMLLHTCLTHAATPASGAYSQVFGGGAITPNNVAINGFSHAKYQSGYLAGITLGYKSGPLRYEIQGYYVNNQVKHYNFNGVRQTLVTGETEASALMTNILYDFEDFDMSLAPYLGVGIGYVYNQTKLSSTVPSISNLDDKKSVFSYQAMGGITYNFSENVALNIDYRYLHTRTINAFGRAYGSHLFAAGAIYRFDNPIGATS